MTQPFLFGVVPISIGHLRVQRSDWKSKEDVPKGGVRPEPVPIGFKTGRHRKTVGQINSVFATFIFQGPVWDTVGQRDTGTKMETAAFSDGLVQKMVIREGLEPSTQWLKAICSTD